MHSRYGLGVTVDGHVYNFRTEDSRIGFDRSPGEPRLDRVLSLCVKGVNHRPQIGDSRDSPTSFVGNPLGFDSKAASSFSA